MLSKTVLSLALLLLTPQPIHSADITLYCKCVCPPHVSVVLTVSKCTLCTKAFCIENEVCPNITLPAVPSVPAEPETTIPVDDKLPVPGVPTASPSPSPSPTLAESPVAVQALLVPRAGESMDGWVAECFQRGSYKDEVVIYSFIVLVLALFGWALLKPMLEPLVERYLAGYLRL
ncbi:hypothetical protein HDU98_010046 [Podochytrium sp. JEL0797]|nr:hypothetical protein HDU98_010046 [Podochytrium sp. JEL0797]